MHLWKLFQPLLSPDGAGGSDSGGTGESELQEDLNTLSGDDTSEDKDDDGTGEGGDDGEGRSERRRAPSKAESAEVKGDEDEDDEDTVEGDEDEGEDEPEDDEEDKDEEGKEDEEKEKPQRILGRPTIQQIKAASKDIFKTLPGLRDIYFAEQEYRKHIADPAQAEEFATKATHFDTLESSLVEGNPAVLLSELKAGNAEAFGKVADNLLPTLRKVDQQAYSRITLPVIREFLFHAAKYGETRKGKEGENIKASAEWLSDFAFANGGTIEPLEDPNKKHPAEIELEKEREKASNERYQGALNDVNTKIDRTLLAMVHEGMDPSLSKFVKDAIVGKTLDELIAGIPGDKPFVARLRGLWNRAKMGSYPENVKQQIVEAHVQRARGIVREIRNRLVLEAKGGVKKVKRRVEGEEEEQVSKGKSTQPTRKVRFESQGRRPSGASSRREAVLDSSKIDYSRTSDKDLLSGDPRRIHLKR